MCWTVVMCQTVIDIRHIRDIVVDKTESRTLSCLVQGQSLSLNHYIAWKSCLWSSDGIWDICRHTLLLYVTPEDWEQLPVWLGWKEYRRGWDAMQNQIVKVVSKLLKEFNFNSEGTSELLANWKPESECNDHTYPFEDIPLAGVWSLAKSTDV